MAAALAASGCTYVTVTKPTIGDITLECAPAPTAVTAVRPVLQRQ